MGNAESQKRHQSEGSGKGLPFKSRREHSTRNENAAAAVQTSRKSTEHNQLQRGSSDQVQKILSNVENQDKNESAHVSVAATGAELPSATTFKVSGSRRESTLEQPVCPTDSSGSSFPDKQSKIKKLDTLHHELVKEKLDDQVGPVATTHDSNHTENKKTSSKSNEFPKKSCEDDISVASIPVNSLPASLVASQDSLQEDVEVNSACTNNVNRYTELIIDLAVKELLEGLIQLVIVQVDTKAVYSNLCEDDANTHLRVSNSDEAPFEVFVDRNKESDACTVNAVIGKVDQELTSNLIGCDHTAEAGAVMEDTEDKSIIEEVTVLLDQLVYRAARGRLKSILRDDSSGIPHHKSAHVQFDVAKEKDVIFVSRQLSLENRDSADPIEKEQTGGFEVNSIDSNDATLVEEPPLALNVAFKDGNSQCEDTLKLVRLSENITTNVILSSVKLIECEDISSTVKIVLESMLNSIVTDTSFPDLSCESSTIVVDKSVGSKGEAYKPCTWSDTTSSASSNEIENWVATDVCAEDELYCSLVRFEDEIAEDTSSSVKESGNEAQTSVTSEGRKISDGKNEHSVTEGFESKILSDLLNLDLQAVSEDSVPAIEHSSEHVLESSQSELRRGQIKQTVVTSEITDTAPQVPVAAEIVLQPYISHGDFLNKKQDRSIVTTEERREEKIASETIQPDPKDQKVPSTREPKQADKSDESSDSESERSTTDDDSSEDSRESRLADKGARLLKRKEQEIAGRMKLRNNSLETSSIASTGGVYNHSASSSFSEPNSTFAVDALTSNQELKSAFTQLEEKYRQAMVQSAQLDNERSQLLYQTRHFQDLLEEQEDDYYRLQSEHRASCQEVERQKRTIQFLEKKCQDLQEALSQRDELIQEQGLVVVGGDHMTHVDGRRSDYDEYASSKLAVVTPEAAEVLHSAGDGPLDSRLKNLADEKQELQDQVRRLQYELDEERRKVLVNGEDDTLRNEARLPEMQLLEIQREANKAINEYKLRLQKSEQDVAAYQGNIARLEGQLGRLKQTSEMYERSEDDLRAEKRKLMRDLRTALDRIEEMEMTNAHLEKRLERVRASRATLGQT